MQQNITKCTILTVLSVGLSGIKYTHTAVNHHDHSCLKSVLMPHSRGVKLIFPGGHISLPVAFKGLNVILGLCISNCSLTRGKELSTATG